MTPFGIGPATFRIVAQHLNHCATAVPRLFVIYLQLFKKPDNEGKEIVNYLTDFLPSRWVATSESFLVASRRKTNIVNLISKARNTGKVEFHATGHKANKF